MNSVSKSSVHLKPVLLRSGVSPNVATAVACLCAFMVVMDSAIVNVALPSIATDLNLSVIGQQWIIDLYLLTLGGFMMLAARASDLFGRKNILQIGLILFTGASLVGGFSMNGQMLMLARAAQGLGGAVLATSTFAVIVAAHPRGKNQDHAVALWAASSSMASAFGTVFGGFITHFLNWRWVMFVNIPIGITLSMIVAVSMIRPSQNNTNIKLDIPGALLITFATTLFIFGITQSTSAGWNSPMVSMSICTSIILFIVFGVVESRVQQPLLRLTVFRHRNVKIGVVMILGLGAILTANIFFLSQTLQQVSQYGVLQTGLAMLPMASVMAVASISSRYIREAGFTRLPFWGGITAAVGFVWLNWLPVNPQYVTQFLLPTLLVGSGIGFMLMTAIQAVLAGVPQEESGIVSGLQNTARQLGGALGVAILVTLSQAVTTGQESIYYNTTAVRQMAGYHAAFLVAGVVSATFAVLSLLLKRNPDEVHSK
ncbi:MFS transporter [Clostridium sp. OS1-26]|uniref:MFS transporter n=1 Tax=Clostridium sp. OS1-26 TaxID=3070681 RepID=UPI0027E08C6B|nr:MFS transporter [Clostridium sp. OS1-26]WML37685.1 MFS transporter [Clostridium sp. OS1-26]